LHFGVLFAAVLLALGCSDPAERTEQYRARANEYFENEQWNEAKIEFVNLLQVAPEDAESHYKMGQVLFRLQEYREGLGQLSEAVRLDPENTAWRLELGQVLAAARGYDAAREHIDVVLTAEPENVVALLVRGGLRSVSDDLEGMLADVDAVLEIDPQNGVALGMKAQALARSGNVAGGEEYWRKLLEIAPSSANYVTLARFLASLERQDEALVASRAAISAAEGESERVAAQMNLANLHLNMGDRASTLRVLQEAREQNPDNSEITLTMARLYFATGEPERAEGLLREHADENPDSSEPHLMLADYYQASGQLEQASEAIDRALAANPDSEPAQLRRAEYLYTRGGEDEAARAEAREIVKTVLGKNPESVTGHLIEGKFYLAEGRYEEAATSLRGVIAAQPSANAHTLLGDAYRRMGELDLARRELQRALQLDAQSLQARTSLAALYLQTGDSELAEREARRAAEASPGDGRSKLILASALIRLQRPEQALEALEPIGQGAGMSGVARLDLARLRFRAGDSTGARSILTELLDLPELRIGAQAELINIDLGERKPHDAIARLDGWISQDPERAELYLFRGRVRLGLGADSELAQLSEAEADLKAAIDKGLSGIQAHLLLASLYLRNGSTDAALQTLLDAGPGRRHPRAPQEHGRGERGLRSRASARPVAARSHEQPGLATCGRRGAERRRSGPSHASRAGGRPGPAE
jgi:tetratricopeptide (TPR) repeat protein